MHGLPTVLLDVRGRGYTKFFEEPAVLYTAGSVAELTALIREFLVSAGPSPDREAALLAATVGATEELNCVFRRT